MVPSQITPREEEAQERGDPLSQSKEENVSSFGNAEHSLCTQGFEYYLLLYRFEVESMHFQKPPQLHPLGDRHHRGAVVEEAAGKRNIPASSPPAKFCPSKEMASAGA